MPRTTPPDRMEKLLDAAAAAFIQYGFHRTQMDDIADRLGTSKGTIYRSVVSKEALFAAVIKLGDSTGAIGELPSGTDLDAAAAAVTSHLAQGLDGLELTEVVTTRRRLRPPATFRAEVERLASEVHEVMRSRRTALMVLDRCADEIPELAAVWFGEGRYALVDLWDRYLALRTDHVADDIDRPVLARTVVEVITTWAVKMPWDPAPRPYPVESGAAVGAMVRNLVTRAAP